MKCKKCLGDILLIIKENKHFCYNCNCYVEDMLTTKRQCDKCNRITIIMNNSKKLICNKEGCNGELKIIYIEVLK